jgi:hypothetical protein
MLKVSAHGCNSQPHKKVILNQWSNMTTFSIWSSLNTIADECGDTDRQGGWYMTACHSQLLRIGERQVLVQNGNERRDEIKRQWAQAKWRFRNSAPFPGPR